MEGQKESPEYSVYAVRNTRRLMEDRHVVIPDLLSQFKDKGDKQYSYYAVFDGHAGPDAAQFAADNLHKNLVESSFFQSGNILDAFRHAYALTDFQYTEKSERDGIKSGCTAVTCLLENKKKLHMAWVGDSVALLSRNGKPCFIMEPHNLERDDEKERVESMGGAVIYFDTWRVNGTLSVSRAIGDPEYKPYVCSDPDIEQIDLDGTEDFLIIGCDGLWDRMSPEDAIGLIYQHIQSKCHLEPSEIVKDTAKVLAERSIEDGSNDNVTTIVIFLRDVASILNTSSSVPSETSNNVFGAKLNGDNSNTYDLPTGLNNIHTSNSNNNNNYDNGLIDTSDYDSRPTDNGLINKEVIDDTIGASEDKDIVSQLEGKNSTLNPFADEFQPNITSNNIIENQFGNEPKKDDEELNKNDGLEKKDLWMSDFKNDGNNEQHQQDYSNQAEMLDGLVVNGLSASENLSGSDVNQPNYSSRFEENLLSSEEVVQQNPHDLAQEPSAPELISIDQEQFTTMEANISQAEIFVGNLTPTEVPSTPVANNQVTDFPSELSSQFAGDNSSQYSFETTQSNPESNVNQYITSVSDAMISESYQDPYFASDSVEPESIIVNTCDDAISSGPHAIDPYSGDDKELESDSTKELAEVPLNQPLTEEVAIEVTDNAPLGSSNPFGSSILNESQAHLAEELEAKMPREEEKSFFTEDTSFADNSSALLDFSADQVDEIVLSPYPANESSIMETKFEQSIEEPITEQELISQQEVSPPEKSEDLSVITEKTTELTINDESGANVPLDAPITESNQTENITELICGSTEENPSEAIASSKTEASKEEETVGVTTTTVVAAAAIAVTAAAVSGAAISSKSSQPVIKESTTQAKSSIAKKSTAPLSKTTSRTTASSVKPSTATITRKPLPTTSTTRTASSRPNVGLASSKLPSKPTSTSTSTATVKSSTTSRVGTTSTLNKKPTSTTTSGISRISSLASRTSSSTAPSSSSTTTGKTLTRTTTTTASSAASRKPLSTTTTSGTTRTTSTTKPTLSSRTTTSSSRTVTSSTARTGVKETDKKETSTGLTKPTTKRASTGSMLNRPSPGASSLTNKVSSSALNRSMTSSSRPGATTNTTVSKLSTRPSSSTMSSTRSPGLSSTRSLGAKTSATTTTKSTTSTNKVAVSRLGANKKPTASTTTSKEATSVTNSSSINSTGEVINCNDQKTSSSSPVDATTNLIGTTSNAITNSIKRDKNMPNSANSLKDELEAALASPISCEDKGVIKGTKENESSGNL